MLVLSGHKLKTYKASFDMAYRTIKLTKSTRHIIQCLKILKRSVDQDLKAISIEFVIPFNIDELSCGLTY